MNWNPSAEFAKDAEVLPIQSPPCPGCKHWRPTRQHDSAGAFVGVRLCQAEEMAVDFSCFASRELAPKLGALGLGLEFLGLG